jgi:hypothetical protein
MNNTEKIKDNAVSALSIQYVISFEHYSFICCVAMFR